jgi:hypothetical protein
LRGGHISGQRDGTSDCQVPVPNLACRTDVAVELV